MYNIIYIYMYITVYVCICEYAMSHIYLSVLLYRQMLISSQHFFSLNRFHSAFDEAKKQLLPATLKRIILFHYGHWCKRVIQTCRCTGFQVLDFQQAFSCLKSPEVFAASDDVQTLPLKFVKCFANCSPQGLLNERSPFFRDRMISALNH